MTNLTVKELANEIQISVDQLIDELGKSGIKKMAKDSVTAQEKDTLLAHLDFTGKLTLQRKMRSTLNISGTGGKNKSVKIEFRKKKTFIKHTSKENLDVFPSETIDSKSETIDSKSETIDSKSETIDSKIDNQVKEKKVAKKAA